MPVTWWKRLRSAGCQRRFAVEQGPLALDAPAVAAEAAVRPDNPVAGYYHCQFIGCTGRGNSASGLGVAQHSGEFAVADCGTCRNSLKGLPDFTLEVRSEERRVGKECRSR